MTEKEIRIFNWLREKSSDPGDIMFRIEPEDVDSIESDPDNNRVSIILKNPAKYVELKFSIDIEDKS